MDSNYHGKLLLEQTIFASMRDGQVVLNRFVLDPILYISGVREKIRRL